MLKLFLCLSFYGSVYRQPHVVKSVWTSDFKSTVTHKNVANGALHVTVQKFN